MPLSWRKRAAGCHSDHALQALLFVHCCGSGAAWVRCLQDGKHSDELPTGSALYQRGVALPGWFVLALCRRDLYCCWLDVAMLSGGAPNVCLGVEGVPGALPVNEGALAAYMDLSLQYGGSARRQIVGAA